MFAINCYSALERHERRIPLFWLKPARNLPNRTHSRAAACGGFPKVIQAAGRCIFYGTDTAGLPESTWQAFHAHRLRFDVVVLDHTYGPGHPGDDHLGARDVAAYTVRLRADGLLADGGRVLATHIAHDANPPHPELAAYAAAHGYEIAYDGLSL